jgi:hypothetical protein
MLFLKILSTMDFDDFFSFFLDRRGTPADPSRQTG